MTPFQPEPPDFDEPDPEPANALEPTIDAGDLASVRRQVRVRAKQTVDEAEFWQAILSTEQGRRELWRMLAEAGTFDHRSGISANGSFDPVLSAFHAGQKALGNHFFSRWLSYSQADVLQMLVENQPGAKPVAASKPRRKTPTSA